LPKKTSFACFQGKKKLCFFKPFALQSNGSKGSFIQQLNVRKSIGCLAYYFKTKNPNLV
jgi:hypothetical protein